MPLLAYLRTRPACAPRSTRLPPPARAALRAGPRDVSACDAGCEPLRLGAPADDALLTVRGATIRYGGRVAVEHVDLDVRAGRVTALIGPSGCGKTSVLSCLNRMHELVPGCTLEGSVRFAGADVRTLDPAHLRRRVGVVFQRPNLFPLSIRRNLELPLAEHGVPAGDLCSRIEDVLRQVGLWEELGGRLDEPALGLSGGQQQRLCLARALTLRPELLLMDEPCSALDPIATDGIERLVDRMRGAYTFLIVTHNLAQARRVADDVAVFWSHGSTGCLVEAGPAARVFERPSRAPTRAYLAGLRG